MCPPGPREAPTCVLRSDGYMRVTDIYLRCPIGTHFALVDFSQNITHYFYNPCLQNIRFMIWDIEMHLFDMNNKLLLLHNIHRNKTPMFVLIHRATVIYHNWPSASQVAATLSEDLVKSRSREICIQFVRSLWNLAGVRQHRYRNFTLNVAWHQ